MAYKVINSYEDSVEDGLYWTNDIALATYLSLTSPISTTRVEEGHRNKGLMLFGFTDSRALEKEVGLFRNGLAQVNPEEYYFQLVRVRNKINSVIRK